MTKKVILSERRGYFRQWASQFAAADPDHEMILAGSLRRTASHRSKLRYIEQYYKAAARAAGNGGTVIISLGHGSSSDTDTTVGMVDLLPARALRIQREQVRYQGSEAQEGYINVVERTAHLRPSQCRRILRRYDFNDATRRPEPQGDDVSAYYDCSSLSGGQAAARTNELFMRIGEILTSQGVSKVVLLTCRVGNATSFLDRLSINWNCITIAAYTERVAANNDGEDDNPYYLYLVNHEQRKYRTDLPNRLLHETSTSCPSSNQTQQAHN